MLRYSIIGFIIYCMTFGAVNAQDIEKTPAENRAEMLIQNLEKFVDLDENQSTEAYNVYLNSSEQIMQLRQNTQQSTEEMIQKLQNINTTMQESLQSLMREDQLAAFEEYLSSLSRDK